MTNFSGKNLNVACDGPKGGGMDSRRNALEQTVPEGYKHTEVGLIPISWSLMKLEHLTSLIIDGTHHTPTYTSFGVPFLRVTDIQGPLDDSKFKYVSEQEHKVLIKRCKPELGDLLLSKNGTIGIPKVVDWEWDFSVFVSLALIKPIKKLLNSSYLEQYFKSDFLKLQLSQRAKQGTVTNLHLEEIRELLIPVPEAFKEQTAIANALSDVDALLTELEKMIAKKQAIKTATMQQMLTGKTRLPQFATYTEGEKKSQPKGTKPSELGEIPEDWNVILLNDISVISRLAGAEYTSFWKEEPTGEIITLRGFNIGKNRIINRELTRISNSLSMKLKRSRLTKGDVIYPCVGSIGNAAVIYDDNKYHIQQNIARITPLKSKLNSEFLCFYLMSELATKEVERFTATTSQPSVLVSSLRQYRLPIPKSLKEQTAIATILSDMDNEIQTLEQRLAKTRQIKQGMMQELLTGRTRLPFDKEAQQGN